ncbi:MAG: AI-2E family transporter, partial [Candidatus Eremiobacteraeota bacterium]|nr:AI-2E family transporter [Candidatus Eremiobacteraeota bacterium]
MNHDPLPPPAGPSRPMWRDEAKVTYAVKILLLIVLAGMIASAIVDFIGRIATVGIIVMGAIFFSYLIYPLVRRLSARFSVGVSIGIVYAAFAAILIFGVAVIVPALSANVKDFVVHAPSMTQNMQRALATSNNPVVQHLPPAARDYIAKLPATMEGLASRYGADAASKTFAILLSTVSLLLLFIIIPVVAAYM